MRWFEGCDSVESGKKRYRELVMENHPDRGGSTQTMQDITAAYEVFLRHAPQMSTTAAREQHGIVHTHEYYEVLSWLLARKENIEVREVGDWIWVFGASGMIVFPLTMMGFQYSKTHDGMYWIDKPARVEFRQASGLTLDQIEARYGSKTHREKRYVS